MLHSLWTHALSFVVGGVTVTWAWNTYKAKLAAKVKSVV